MKKIVGVASIPERKLGLFDTLYDLSKQVDHIYVWLNNYTAKPETTFKNVTFIQDIDAKAIGKVKTLDFIPDKEFYFFTADDDIRYPSDYVEVNIRQYKPGTIQSSHAKIFSEYPVRSFNHGDISKYHFAGPVLERKRVHAVGTGVCLMDSSVARLLPYDKFLQHPNMLDIWTSAFALSKGIELYSVPHPPGWLVPNHRIDQTDSIWETTKVKGDEIRTTIFNHYVTESNFCIP